MQVVNQPSVTQDVWVAFNRFSHKKEVCAIVLQCAKYSMFWLLRALWPHATHRRAGNADHALRCTNSKLLKLPNRHSGDRVLAAKTQRCELGTHRTPCGANSESIAFPYTQPLKPSSRELMPPEPAIWAPSICAASVPLSAVLPGILDPVSFAASTVWTGAASSGMNEACRLAVVHTVL